MRHKIVFVAVAVVCLAAFSAPGAHATKDPLWPEQYGPSQIGAPAAWTKAVGRDVTIAVIDTGVDVDHPDLKDKLDLANSRDIACNDPNPDDDSDIAGHGTHVAGTAAAATDNGIGVAGVAPAAKIIGLKIERTGDCNSGVLGVTGAAAFPEAIRWAVDRGAKVINLSYTAKVVLTAQTRVDQLETPCRQAYARGTLCVLAAGNSGETKASGYARDLPAMVVTANDSAGRHAGFAQKADTMWGVSAPGVAVLNTWPIDDNKYPGYHTIQGTSMAAPHVAGAAAVLFSMGLNARQVAETLVRTAGPSRDSDVEGAGIIHLDKAVGVDTGTTPGAPPAAGGAGPGAVTRGPKATTAPAASTGGNRSGPGAAVTVPSEADDFLPEQGSAFEDGIAGEGSKDSIENILLKTPRKTSANKPFNAVIPIAVISLVALAAGAFVGIPRLRARDTPSL